MQDALLLAAAVLVTSTLSGVFGMGGGMILMGVYAALLPVRDAMVLHGATQLASNGARAWLLRRHLYRPALAWYVPGAALGVVVFVTLDVVPDRATLFVVLGALPLAAALLPSSAGLSIQSRPLAAACGLVVTAAQLTAGVSGPLLDVFFVRGTLSRHEVIGTKAVTQTLGHLLKLVFFGVLVTAPAAIVVPPLAFVLVVACAVAGTRCGKALLGRLDDRRFRLASRALILVLAAFYVARGLALR